MKRHGYSVAWWDCFGIQHCSLVTDDYNKAARRKDALSVSLRSKLGIMRRVDIVAHGGRSKLPSDDERRRFYAQLYDPANRVDVD
jgi:hypothetical protein